MDRVILLDVQDPQDGFDGTVVAVVEMTPLLAKLILSRAKIAQELKKADEQFARIAFYDRHVSYFEHTDELTTEQCESLVDETPVIVKENPFGDDDVNTQYDQMIVDTETVWWRTSAKHTEVFSTTASIYLTEITKFLSEDK